MKYADMMLTGQRNVPSSSSAQAAKQGDDLKAPLRLTQTRRVEFGLQNFDLSTKPRDSSAQVIAGCSTTRASISVPHPTTAKGKRSLEEALLIADQARQKELAQGGVTAKKTNPEPKDALEEEALNLLRCLLSDVDVSSVVPSSPPSSLKRKREDEGDETNSPQVSFCPSRKQSLKMVSIADEEGDARMARRPRSHGVDFANQMCCRADWQCRTN